MLEKSHSVLLFKEQFYLSTSQREVVSSILWLTPIVCGEDYESVVVHVVLLQCSGHIANSFIQSCHHAKEGSPILVLNFGSVN